MSSEQRDLIQQLEIADRDASNDGAQTERFQNWPTQVVVQLPPGVILAWTAALATAAPVGYLLCDGDSYLRADYPDLFAVIGTKFGADDGDHFNVPTSAEINLEDGDEDDNHYMAGTQSGFSEVGTGLGERWHGTSATGDSGANSHDDHDTPVEAQSCSTAGGFWGWLEDPAPLEHTRTDNNSVGFLVQYIIKT